MENRDELRENVEEKRAYRRLNIRLPLEFQKEGAGRKASRTTTINVSTGGVYFETAAEDIGVGDKLTFELAVPPEDARFPPEGKITTKGKVVRAAALKEQPNNKGVTFSRFGVAAQFEEGFKLKF